MRLGSHRPAVATLCFVSGVIGVSASFFLGDRCGPLLASRASLVIPAQVDPWGSPIPNTFGYTPNLWAELSGSFTAPKFRFHALAEALYQCSGVQMLARG
jgi:hypothetical protein